MNHITVLMGCSATGKSTRVYQFFKFCEDVLNFHIEDFFYKGKNVGKIIKEMNLLIFGRRVVSANKEKWQGFDILTSYFEGSENVSLYLREIIKEYNILLEGASIFDSFRFRPVYFEKTLGIENYDILVYLYNTGKNQEFLDRVIMRSGKLPPSGAMWNKNNSFIRTPLKTENDAKELGLDPKPFLDHLHEIYFDEPVTQLGEFLFKKHEKEQHIDSFKTWSTKNDFSKKFVFDQIEKVQKVAGSIFGDKK